MVPGCWRTGGQNEEWRNGGVEGGRWRRKRGEGERRMKREGGREALSVSQGPGLAASNPSSTLLFLKLVTTDNFFPFLWLSSNFPPSALTNRKGGGMMNDHFCSKRMHE